MILYACGEIGLSQEEFFDLTTLDYFLLELAYRTKLARAWEPTRELIAVLNNMFAEEKDRKQAYELIPLLTDVVKASRKNDKESPSDFWKRMVANKFYKTTTTKE